MDVALSRPRASVLARAVASLATAAAGLLVLLTAGRPPEPMVAVILIGAVAATELLLVDFPDRRGVSLATLPLLFAASDSAATAVWAAGLGTLIGSLTRRAPTGVTAFAFVRAAAAASIATTVVDLVDLGRLGSPSVQMALGPSLLLALLFAGISEALNMLERRVGGLSAPSRVDLMASVGLVPLALAAWALQERIGMNGLALAGGGLLALLIVVRSSVNNSTRNADLERLTALAQQVAASATPAESLAALERGLPAWVRFDQLWLALPVADEPAAVHTAGQRELLPPTLTLTPELGRLGEAGPRALPAEMLLRGRADVAVLAARYGKAGLLLIARAGRPFTAEESALLDLLLGQLSATLEQIRLVDELERTMAALRAAQQERDDYVNVMTHDLRQPLAGMLGYAQLLERSLRATEADEKQLKYAHGIAIGGERMMRMVSNLLEIARMESGRVELESTVVHIDRLVDEIVETLQATLEMKRLSVRVDVSPDVPPIESAEPLLRESLANLVGNAAKYTPEGGHVEVRARLAGDRVELQVVDDGIGIPPDALPRLFGRFYRTGQAEVRELRGSGLGLALTKMMIEKLGGTITVASELGKGSTFTVTLPAHPASASSPAPTAVVVAS
jgi:signal transduction histidine kinase